MGRPAVELSRAALDAAATWRDQGSGYREIASELYRRHMVAQPMDAATVRRHLVAAGRAKRQRRRVVRGRGARTTP